MAILVNIKKVSEEKDLVIYEYSGNKGSRGTFSISISTGIIEPIDPKSPKDAPPPYGLFFHRAASKIQKYHQSGEYPDNATYMA